jgi:hypothetical protein
MCSVDGPQSSASVFNVVIIVLVLNTRSFFYCQVISTYRTQIWPQAWVALSSCPVCAARSLGAYKKWCDFKLLFAYTIAITLLIRAATLSPGIVKQNEEKKRKKEWVEIYIYNPVVHICFWCRITRRLRLRLHLYIRHKHTLSYFRSTQDMPPNPPTMS